MDDWRGNLFIMIAIAYSGYVLPWGQCLIGLQVIISFNCYSLFW